MNNVSFVGVEKWVQRRGAGVGATGRVGAGDLMAQAALAQVLVQTLTIQVGVGARVLAGAGAGETAQTTLAQVLVQTLMALVGDGAGDQMGQAARAQVQVPFLMVQDGAEAGILGQAGAGVGIPTIIRTVKRQTVQERTVKHPAVRAPVRTVKRQGTS
ncbi:hypothetical protein F2Q69_00052781 [Brassica cretica]|uniref:Uncharacterized protein n=1 Tax=Brassica cretica TaxID=69181 RepID=A0A8S9N2K1_BRACR|nr:hypothetical protein F2Q69_00052781 [Brassica cretica]